MTVRESWAIIFYSGMLLAWIYITIYPKKVKIHLTFRVARYVTSCCTIQVKGG